MQEQLHADPEDLLVVDEEDTECVDGRFSYSMAGVRAQALVRARMFIA
jgi:hypothetical protein